MVDILVPRIALKDSSVLTTVPTSLRDLYGQLSNWQMCLCTDAAQSRISKQSSAVAKDS